jgi:hypothetical protein
MYMGQMHSMPSHKSLRFSAGPRQTRNPTNTENIQNVETMGKSKGQEIKKMETNRFSWGRSCSLGYLSRFGGE